ncbi:MAG: aldo/keto reductase [Chthonomonadales bacterium]|nr:aldo/keto reductase [Chthonomonadales bacterium]
MDSRQPQRTVPAPLSRREFVSRLAAAGAGGGLLSAAFAGCSLTRSQRAEATEAMVDQLGKLPKVRLGARMGNMRIAPVLVCQDSARELLGPSLAAGMNFIHKAGYWGEMPDELKKVPRESYFTDITVDSTPDHPDDEDRAYNQVTESLARNGFRYYDIFRAHYGWRSVRALKEQNGTWRAFERLKREGKVRHFGVSQHDYIPYPEMIAAQIADGRVASMQVFFSYGSPQDVHDIFAAARKAGIGMTAMKVNANGRGRMGADPEMQRKMRAPGMIGRSLLRYALTVPASDGKPIFHCCVSSLRNFGMFEENVGAVAARTASVDGFGATV